MLLFSTVAITATKFDHAEYMKPKTEGQKKDDHPVRGSVSFDKDKKTVEFLDAKGASVRGMACRILPWAELPCAWPRRPCPCIEWSGSASSNTITVTVTP
jgi:hypothetical protein